MLFPGTLWLDARKARTEADFHWLTGEPFTFRNFAPGEPDEPHSGEVQSLSEFCAVRGENQLWHDRRCSGGTTIYGVVCEAE